MSTTRQTLTVDAATEVELPEGWASSTLADLIGPNGIFIDGDWIESKDQDPSGDVRLVQLADIGDGHYKNKSHRFLTSEKAKELNCTFLESGDILVARMPDPLGRACIFPGDAKRSVTAVDVCIIRPGDGGVDNMLIAHWINSSEIRGRIEELARGTTRQRISRQNLGRIEFPIPPLAEQTRIVAKIEELLKQVNASRERLTKVPKILKYFRQSILAAACSGRLTEDWREEHQKVGSAKALLCGIRDSHEKYGRGHGGQAADPTEDIHTLDADDFPDSWAVEELKWLCKPGRSITYGILKPGPDYPEGVPYIRVADFPGNRLNVSGIRRTNPTIANEYRRSILEAGDVLLSIRGTVGRVCRVSEELAGANITQDTARISVHSDMSPDYIELYLKSPGVQKRLERAMKGVAVRGVNIGDVRVLQIAVPPIEEQHEIGRRVEALFKLADMIENRVEAATKRADKLTQAILAKAFRGELIPTEAELARREGRDCEPASVLLERIRANRENTAPVNKAKGGTRRTNAKGL